MGWFFLVILTFFAGHFCLVTLVMCSSSIVIIVAFAAFSAYKMVLKSVSFVFFSVIITSAPCLRLARIKIVYVRVC